MDLVTFLRILLRRWDVVLPGFLLTLVTTFAAGGSVTPAYEAQGSLLLFGPATGTSPRGTAPINPYLNFNSSLESTAVIIAESMSSEEIVRQLADLGATAGYEVTATQKTPILTVSARGSSEAQVRHTAQLVLQRVQDELAARQQAAGAPANTLIRSQVLSPPRVSVQAGNKSRVMAAVAVLGLGTTVLLAFAVENLAAWRQRWRQSAPPPASAATALAGTPLVTSQHAANLGATPEAAQGNGRQPQPPSGPLVDVLVKGAEPAPAEDRSEGVTPDEVPPDDRSLEQQDRLVGAWWSAWERRQAGRQAAQAEHVEPTADEPARVEEAEEAGKPGE